MNIMNGLAAIRLRERKTGARALTDTVMAALRLGCRGGLDALERLARERGIPLPRTRFPVDGERIFNNAESTARNYVRRLATALV